MNKFVQNGSLQRKLKMAVVGVVAMIGMECAGLYLASDANLQRITEINRIQRVIELIRIPSSRLLPAGYEGRPIESEKNNALRQSCNKTQPDPDASTGGFDRAFLAA